MMLIERGEGCSVFISVFSFDLFHTTEKREIVYFINEGKYLPTLKKNTLNKCKWYTSVRYKNICQMLCFVSDSSAHTSGEI